MLFEEKEQVALRLNEVQVCRMYTHICIKYTCKYIHMLTYRYTAVFVYTYPGVCTSTYICMYMHV